MPDDSTPKPAAPQSAHAYPFDAFWQDHKAIQESGRLRPNEAMRNMSIVAAYFRERCDPEAACYRSMRFLGIMDVLSSNVESFDDSEFSVYGSERVGALMSEYLFRAAHEVFTTRSIREATSVSPEELLELAARWRDRVPVPEANLPSPFRVGG